MNGRPPSVSADTVAEIVELSKKRWKQREIAEKLGVSRDLVGYYIRRRLGKRHTWKKRKYSDELIEQVRGHYSEGWRVREISEEFDIPMASVNTMIYGSMTDIKRGHMVAGRVQPSRVANPEPVEDHSGHKPALIRKAVSMFGDGSSFDEIAEATGLPEEAAEYHAREAGYVRGLDPALTEVGVAEPVKVKPPMDIAPLVDWALGIPSREIVEKHGVRSVKYLQGLAYSNRIPRPKVNPQRGVQIANEIYFRLIGLGRCGMWVRLGLYDAYGVEDSVRKVLNNWAPTSDYIVASGIDAKSVPVATVMGTQW